MGSLALDRLGRAVAEVIGDATGRLDHLLVGAFLPGCMAARVRSTVTLRAE